MMNKLPIVQYQKIAKYSAVAAVCGILIGAIDALFGQVLIQLTKFRISHPVWFIPFLPLAGMLILLMYRYYSKESLKGMTLVFQTGHGEIQKIPKMLLPLVITGTWITHLFGGSAGREGVAVQLGAVVAHTIGRKMKCLDEPRMLLVIGMAAGFAGLFQTPLAATLFAMEVLVSGVLIHEALLPALIASYLASGTSHLLGLEKFSVLVKAEIDLTPLLGAKLLLAAVLFGVAGGGFSALLRWTKNKLSEILPDPFQRIFITGCILAVLFLVFHMGRYSGLGTNLISASFQGDPVYGYDWILKLLLTVATLSAGFQGGEVTPLFAIGATLGVVLAGILGLPAMLLAALGYAAVFGSATNTLIAPILIGMEVFGPAYMPYFIIFCAIAFVFNGNQSIYTGQKSYYFFQETEKN